MNMPASPETDPVEAGPQAVLEEPQWVDLVRRIRENDPSGMEELYQVFCKGIRFFLYRQLGPQDLDDRVHDVFLVISQAIRRGDLREPERLMGYVRTVVRRQVAACIDSAVRSRRNLTDFDATTPLVDVGASPEQIVIQREHEDIAHRLLNSISKRDKEILVRFYLREQSQETICREMNLTDTQFRLIKSRAKARFGELGKQMISRRRSQAAGNR
jgi:RNA polymerase sigma-70 factor, ECF subfamily